MYSPTNTKMLGRVTAFALRVITSLFVVWFSQRVTTQMKAKLRPFFIWCCLFLNILQFEICAFLTKVNNNLIRHFEATRNLFRNRFTFETFLHLFLLLTCFSVSKSSLCLLLHFKKRKITVATKWFLLSLIKSELKLAISKPIFSPGNSSTTRKLYCYGY